MTKRILVVDDSSVMRMFETMLLRKESYEVLAVQDGAEAVASAMRELPDLILMDANMPNVDGLTACKLLRAEAKTRKVPIIIVTTSADAATVRKAFELQCNDFVSKPIDPTELLTKVRHHLGET